MPHLVIQSIHEETDRIRRFVLIATPEGPPLAGFEAGAHIAVRLGNGDTRQYSLSNPPSSEPSRYEIAVLRESEGRGRSHWFHRNWKEGDAVEVADCANHFPLSVQGSHAILIAEGIGVTPIISMAWSLFEQPPPVEFYYCVRSEANAAFHKHFVDASFSDAVKLILDGGDP